MRLIKNIYYVIIPLLTVGLSFGFTTFPIALLLLLPLFFTTNRHTIGLFLLMYGGPLGGVVRFMYPWLPVYGLLLIFLGVVLIWDFLLDVLKNHIRAIIYMSLVLLVFGFFYLIGPRDNFAGTKYLNMCIHGVMMVFGYYVFDKSPNIDAEGLTRILILSALCMFAHVISVVSITPGGLLDFDWFREQYVAHEASNMGERICVVGYQHIGMLILFAAVIYLSQKEQKPWKFIFYVACTALLTFISGCRQAILGVLFAVVLRLVLFRKRNVQKENVGSTLLWISVAMVVLYFAVTYIFAHLGSEKLSSTLEEGDSGRQILWLQALQIFLDQPILGAGLGGYHFYAIMDDAYPHNFILELLAETGIVGLTFTVLVLVVPLFRQGKGLLHITNSNMFYFLIVVGILVRVMVSSDLTESIELFSAVFAISGQNKLVNKLQIKQN